MPLEPLLQYGDGFPWAARRMERHRVGVDEPRVVWRARGRPLEMAQGVGRALSPHEGQPQRVMERGGVGHGPQAFLEHAPDVGSSASAARNSVSASATSPRVAKNVPRLVRYSGRSALAR